MIDESQFDGIDNDGDWDPDFDDIGSDGLAELSAQIDKRDNLRQELKETQQSIDKTRLNLIEEIQDVANSEQERLSMIKMRSRLATVMADKLLNKLR